MSCAHTCIHLYTFQHSICTLLVPVNTAITLNLHQQPIPQLFFKLAFCLLTILCQHIIGITSFTTTKSCLALLHELTVWQLIHTRESYVQLQLRASSVQLASHRDLHSPAVLYSCVYYEPYWAPVVCYVPSVTTSQLATCVSIDAQLFSHFSSTAPKQ